MEAYNTAIQACQPVLESVHELIAALRVKRNALTPVQQLPVEIMERIIRDDEVRASAWHHSLRRVCLRWTRIIENMAWFWSEFGPKVSWRTLLCLRYSKAGTWPLDIIYGREETVRVSRLRLWLPMSPRWRSLRWAGSPEELRRLLPDEEEVRFPSLEYLSVRFEFDDQVPPSLPSALSNARSVRHLTTNTRALPSTASLLPQLEVLEVKDELMRPRPRRQEFMETKVGDIVFLLGLCQNVTRIDLDLPITAKNKPFEFTPTYVPNLKELNVRGELGVHMYLRALLPPPDARVTLHIWPDVTLFNQRGRIAFKESLHISIKHLIPESANFGTLTLSADGDDVDVLDGEGNLRMLVTFSRTREWCVCGIPVLDVFLSGCGMSPPRRILVKVKLSWTYLASVSALVPDLRCMELHGAAVVLSTLERMEEWTSTGGRSDEFSKLRELILDQSRTRVGDGLAQVILRCCEGRAGTLERLVILAGGTPSDAFMASVRAMVPNVEFVEVV